MLAIEVSWRGGRVTGDSGGEQSHLSPAETIRPYPPVLVGRCFPENQASKTGKELQIHMDYSELFFFLSIISFLREGASLSPRRIVSDFQAVFLGEVNGALSSGLDKDLEPPCRRTENAIRQKVAPRRDAREAIAAKVIDANLIQLV